MLFFKKEHFLIHLNICTNAHTHNATKTGRTNTNSISLRLEIRNLISILAVNFCHFQPLVLQYEKWQHVHTDQKFPVLMVFYSSPDMLHLMGIHYGSHALKQRYNTAGLNLMAWYISRIWNREYRCFVWFNNFIFRCRHLLSVYTCI